MVRKGISINKIAYRAVILLALYAWLSRRLAGARLTFHNVAARHYRNIARRKGALLFRWLLEVANISDQIVDILEAAR